MTKLFAFARAHKTFLLSIGFLVLFSMTVSFATPPGSPYAAGATLDPACAPGASNCTVTPLSVGGTVIANATPSSVLFTDSTNHLTSTGSVPLAQGGTGATDAAGARANLGLSYATTNDVATETNVATWGDSLTAATYPAYFASLTGYTVYNGGVPGETSTQIATRMLAATDKHSWPTIIWAGRNNYTDPTTVKSDIASMVASLSPGTPYLVVSVLNGDTALEYQGQSGYNTIVQLNADLSATYGSHYVDMRSYLVSLYDSGIAQDVIDHGHDVTPSSLRADFLHLNEAGYKDVAQKLMQSATSFQASSEKLITTKNIYSLFAISSPAGLNFSNTQIGQGALKFNTTGINNVASGYRALFYNTTGTNNSAFGFTGLFSNTTGSYNSSVGQSALYLNTTGSYNSALGTTALYSNTTGSNMVGVGSNALYSNTTGTNNTALGYDALYSNVDGISNTGGGANSLFSNTSGSNNAAFGQNSFYFNTTGGSNSGFGRGAGITNTTGSNNSVLGTNAFSSNTTGSNNTVVGAGAGKGVASSSNISSNTLVGYQAGFALLTGGNSNTLIGNQSGLGITTGANNIVIGNAINPNSLTASNQLDIGNAIYGTGIDGAGTTLSTGNIGLFIASPTARLHLPAGTATANTAPLKFTSGTLLGTSEAGAVEYDGAHIYFTATNGGTRYQLDQQSGGSLPTQTGNSGKYLTTDGTTASWVAISGSAGGTVTNISNIDGTITVTNPTTTPVVSLALSHANIWTGAQTFSTVPVTISGNISSSAWATSGLALSVAGATYTDTSTANSGTVALSAANAFGIPTFASTGTSITNTVGATVYIAGAPVNGTNTTISNKVALYVAGGASDFLGGISTFSSVSANFSAAGGLSALNNAPAAGLFAGASTAYYRSLFNGTTSTTLSTGASYSAVVVASAPITTFTSGTHALLANVVVNPLGTVTAGGASITNTASLYVGGASSATVTGSNYAFWVASGLSQFGSASVTTGTTVATFQNAGGTCNVIPSTSGGISCSSDMNLKKNITALADNSAWSFNNNVTSDNQSVLAKVMALTPVNYNWNVESDTDPKHAGFIAQEVRQVFPDLVTEDPKTHLLSLNYAGMMPYAVEAIREMDLNITDIANLDRPNTWREAIIAWLGNSANGIGSIFGKKITSDESTTSKLCIKDANGQTCLDRSQVDRLLQQASGQGSTTSSGPAPVVSSEEPTAPAQDVPAVSDNVQTPEVAPADPAPISDAAEQPVPSPSSDAPTE